ncbi:glycoside-pentoside-hexuronide (GPH):cation symporter [Tessaracoccus sp. OS52]|uniref:cytidylate kinase family protein n=1 Tax=Tessaracoccus sp. OS52 TaxID=2886691 RepID=UPI001D126C5F|nr:cytidylate kinase family protein [Tessaracoccus sp. OS52]MCC2593934.1 glycoside-pentoside-hexuronide (GPH):cation symporter [Tessaracoccus sp. OS52]
MAKESRKQVGTLSGAQVFSYSLGDVANNLTFMMTSMFLMVYMTDIAGVSAGVAGTIYGVTKIWAGVSDLVAGQTVDRTNTRWGRLRPYLLFGSTPLAIVFVLLFSVPAGLSPALTIAWILLLDALFQLGYSFVNIPYGSLAAAMTQDPVDRSKLSGARSIANALTGVILSAIVAPQFQDTTADGVRLRFTLTAIGLGILAVVLYLICFKNAKEVVPRSATKISLKRTVKMIRHNRPLLVLCLAAFFLLAAIFMMNAVGLYYARYILGNAAWFTFLALAQTVGTVVAASLVSGVTSRFGKRNGYMGAAALAILGFLLIFLVPEGSLPIAVVAWFIFGLGSGGTNALMFSMQADTVDYGEWKTGLRSEGGSYSILSFIRKTGQGVGGWGGAAIIGAFGYVAQAEAQDATAQQGIRLATGLVPALLAVAAAVVMIWYNLTVEDHRNLVRDLNDRRSEGAVSTTYGVDAARVVVEELGDARNLLLRPPQRGTLPVVTIFEREGAGASEIGPAVAKKLGVKYVPQKFSSDEVAGVDTRALSSDTGFERWLRTISYTGTQDADMARALDYAEDFSIAQQNRMELLKLAEDGAVIAGRNGALVLGRAVGSFHVRLTAPLPMRIQRVMYKTGLSAEEAEARIKAEDHVRAEMSRYLYQWNPHTDEYYDLVINTGSVTYDQVVDMIVGIYRSKYPEALTPPPTT